MSKRKVFSIGNALAQGLEETVHAAIHHAGKLQLEIIPLSKMELDPENPRELALTMEDLMTGIHPEDPLKERKIKEKASLQSLSETIAQQGLINPVVVYKQGEKYRLIAGERRTLASLLAHKKDIQARIIDKRPTLLKRSIWQWIENVEREDLTLAERIHNLQRIMEAYRQERHTNQVFAKDIAHLIGSSLPQATYYKTVLDAPDPIQKAIVAGDIANLDKAVAIAKAPVELHPSLIEACKKGASLKLLKSLGLKNTNQQTTRFRARGRPPQRIQLGMTHNPQVVKSVVSCVLSHPQFEYLHPILKDTPWNDPVAASRAFKTMI